MRQFQTEHEAILFLAEGNLSAFNFLYNKYSQVIYANIFKFVKNEVFAEDLLQEVFVALWEDRCNIKIDISVGGWLFTVSYNKSISLLKKSLKESIALGEIGKMKNDTFLLQENYEIDYQNRLALVEEALKQLPAKKQEVFRLYRFEHKQPEEISKELGLTIISVKDYLKQSTKLIKQYILLNYVAECSILAVILYIIN